MWGSFMLCNITHKNNHKIKRNDHENTLPGVHESIQYSMIVLKESCDYWGMIQIT